MNKAIFTIVHNEKYFLPIWLKYYSQYFENIVVLDHNTTDGSVEKAAEGYNFYTKRLTFKETFNPDFIKTKVMEEQQRLLSLYPVVVYAEADEFIIPNPKIYNGLGDYINQMKGDMARCNGYEVIQQEGEPTINLGLSILSQRKYWVTSDPACKTLISKKPLKWGMGFHGLETGNPEIDKDLFLLHLKRMDWKMFEKRWLETGLSNDPNLYYEHFHQHDAKLKSMGGNENLIPDYLKNII